MAVASCAWQVRESVGDHPLARQGHSICVKGETIYLFGGSSTAKDGKAIVYHNDLYALNVKNDRMSWKQLEQNGKVPCRRDGHCMCIVDDQMCLFGGKDSVGLLQCLPDLYVCPLDTLKWKVAETQGAAPATLGFTMSQVGRTLYVFGGVEDTIVRNDMFMLNLDSLTWAPLKVSGPAPPPRCDHAAAVVGDDIYVFGGCGGESEWLDDLYIFNTKKLVWFKPRVRGLTPAPRGFHSFIAHREKDIYVFGGMSDTTDDNITIYGDLFKLSVAHNKWKHPLYSGLGARKRYSHAACIIHSHLYIIGGMSDTEELIDVRVLKLINPSERQPVMKPLMAKEDASFVPTRVPKLKYDIEHPPFSKPDPIEGEGPDYIMAKPDLLKPRGEALDKMAESFDVLHAEFKKLEQEKALLAEAKKELERDRMAYQILYNKQQKELEKMREHHELITQEWLYSRRAENDLERQEIAKQQMMLAEEKCRLQEEKQELLEKGRQLHSVADQFKGI